MTSIQFKQLTSVVAEKGVILSSSMRDLDLIKRGHKSEECHGALTVQRNK